MRASDPRPAPVPTKRRRLRTHGIDEAGGIRLPAGAATAEVAPSPPASAPSPEAVLIAAAPVDRGARAGSDRVRPVANAAWVGVWRVGSVVRLFGWLAPARAGCRLIGWPVGPRELR